MVGREEFFQDGLFIIVVREVERSVFLMPDAGFGADFFPDGAAAHGGGVERAGGLADGPNHAKIAHTGSVGLAAAFDNGDGIPAAGQGPGGGEADDAGSDDDGFHGVDGCLGQK